MTFTSSQKTGLVATLFLHALILLLLLYMSILAPVPPIEEGLLVDFGNSMTGLGSEEPSAVQSPDLEATTPKSAKEVKAVNIPKPAIKAAEGEEDIVTQDYEKTITLAKVKKKALEDKKTKKIEEDKKLRELEAQRKQELEDQRLLAEKERKIGAINSRVKNAFGGGKTDNSSLSTSQGNTYGKGNMGSPDGTPGVNQYGSGGGMGSGQGISFSLSGRSARSIPKPTFPGNESGTVVVEVIVNKYGKVTKALPGIKGSNTVDPDLLEAARKAAMSATFNTDNNAPAFQKGSITYHFILQ